MAWYRPGNPAVWKKSWKGSQNI